MSPARKEHVGTIGDRLHILASVFFVKVMQNKYGYTYLALMRDDEGHTLKTFYSGRKWQPKEGQRIEITATIKAHDEYKGTATTELRNAVIKDLGVANGYKECKPNQLPRAEELRFNEQKKAQHAFVSNARGVPHAR